MYEGHFQLNRRPFAATPDPGCCYLSPTQAPLIQSVARCIEHGQGVAILTGPAGVGKTLLTQVLLADAEPRFTGAYLGTGQFPTCRALLQTVLYELGQPYGGMTDQELRLELNTTLRNLITRKDGLLLVLDEAHLLSDRLLEEVRLLADLAQNGVPLTRVVLSGNPEFEERLTSPALAAFNQRVACHVVLETLTRPESVSYLEHRIRWAGGFATDLFDRDALQLIADASDGLPRCLNQLADHSLMQAFLAGHSKVTASLVRQTLAELQHLPLRWNPSALHDRTQQRNAMVTTTVVEESAAAPKTATVVEVGDSNDSSTCCFEFGADESDNQFTSARPEEGTPVATDTASVYVDEDADSIRPDEMSNSIVPPIGIIEVSNGDHTLELEDEDGPPLFPWLAKPAIEVVATSDDAYSASSFNIPARHRKRAEIVELEVVSTAPLSGPELLAKRRSDGIRDGQSSAHTSSTHTSKPKEFLKHPELLAEEVVCDPYSQLDSRLAPVFPRPRVSFPNVSVPASRIVEVTIEKPEEEIPLTVESLEPIRETLPSIEHMEIHSIGNPLDRIDAICALLDEVNETSQGNGGVELITDYGVERIDVDLPASIPAPAEMTAQDQPAVDLEYWIGSTVVEVGRNVQQARAASAADSGNQARATRIEQLLESLEREIQFDIVEPVATGSAAPERTNPIPDVRQPPEGYSGVVPPPNHSYKNFFSMLRRRQIR